MGAASSNGQELGALLETARDTSEMQKLRRDRRRATQRVVTLAKRRGAPGAGETCTLQDARHPPTDAYTSAAGEKVGSLFHRRTFRTRMPW